VAFADRDVERGKRVAAEIAASGGQVIFVEAHVQREMEAAASPTSQPSFDSPTGRASAAGYRRGSTGSLSIASTPNTHSWTR